MQTRTLQNGARFALWVRLVCHFRGRCQIQLKLGDPLLRQNVFDHDIKLKVRMLTVFVVVIAH